MGEPCYSIVRKPKGFEAANEFALRKGIEGENLNRCQDAIEELLQNLLDGERLSPNLMMPVINRFQMNTFRGVQDQNDKRVKKLLYILWECLPKREPNGKFLDKLVMVCGAFDKDLKHPNQYVCGAALRTLSKTRENEVIRELVHSIEKCLEWSHAYQRKNAVFAIAQIYKCSPDLNPSAPRTLSEYLLKEDDHDCKRAALQALLEIAPDEAKSYLHSCNIPDIHCMNASIQLLFVKLIQRVFKKGTEESNDHIKILTSLIRSSSSPSVRYEAASTLMRFSRDPENVKLVARCFTDICAKESDNNVKLIALDNLMSLRRIRGAERILRDCIMDVLFILQSATDFELHEKILKLTIDLISPLNVSGVVSALRHELKRIQDNNVLGSQQETVKYRRLLVDTVHKIADRFPHAVSEYEMLDTLFDLLTCPTIGERTSTRLILLFKMFMAKNSGFVGLVVKKIQDSFNIVRDNISTHRGLIQLLGDFSETKEQIENSYKAIKDSLGELPIVASEKKRALRSQDGTGDETGVQSKDENPNGLVNVDSVTKSMSRLVTADGSYAAQTAINFHSTIVSDDNPPLRSYFLKNKFDTSSVLCYALLKMACRYQQVESSKAETDKMIARFMFIIASILNLGHSTLVDSEGNPIQINHDQSESLMLGLTILQHLSEDSNGDISKLIRTIVLDNMRKQLNIALKHIEQDRLELETPKTKKQPRFDDRISISLFSSREDDVDSGFDDLDEKETSISMPDLFAEIPLTGTIDPIYAYCEFDVSSYDIGLKIHLENRSATKTFENVTLELASRSDGASKPVDRPEPIVLAPRANACIRVNVKIASSENRRLFGSISFDVLGTEGREQVIVLNDISINISDYIKPCSISLEEFRDIWRDCEWENKVSVRTKLTNLKDYLTLFISSTNMRCLTAEHSLSGDCAFLSANLYARSSFGEEALVNVSIEKATPTSIVTGSAKIRSRSQGVALSLGDKITAAQNASLGGAS